MRCRLDDRDSELTDIWNHTKLRVIDRTFVVGDVVLRDGVEPNAGAAAEQEQFGTGNRSAPGSFAAAMLLRALSSFYRLRTWCLCVAVGAVQFCA